MLLGGLLKKIGWAFYFCVAISGSTVNATPYVSPVSGGVNISATNGIDINFISNNYDILRGYDIGQEVLSIMMPESVETIVKGIGGGVVDYVKVGLIKGAKEVYHVDVSGLVNLFTPKYDNQTVVAKSRITSAATSFSMLSTARSFSFEKALGYFNAVMLTIAGSVVSWTFFRTLWVMMSVNDDNASYKRLLMLFPSIGVVVFTLMPTSTGLSSGQMVLVAAFLVSNYVGSVLVTIPAFFFPIMAVDSTFNYNNVVSGGGNDSELMSLLQGVKAEINSGAGNLFLSEVGVEAFLNDGLLSMSTRLRPSDIGGDESPFRERRSLGGETVTYTNDFVKGKLEPYNSSRNSWGVSLPFIDYKCVASKDWDKIYPSRGCQTLFLKSSDGFLIGGTADRVFDTQLGSLFYDAVKDRVEEMKELVCYKLSASDRKSSYVCQKKDANGFTGRLYGETRPDTKSILNYKSFDTSDFKTKLISEYRSKVAAEVAHRIRKDKSYEIDMARAKIYVRGIISTPYQILTRMMTNDGRNLAKVGTSNIMLSSLIDVRNGVSRKLLNDLSAVGGGITSIDLGGLLKYARIPYSRIACQQDATYCSYDLSEHQVDTRLRVFSRFDGIFYPILGDSSQDMTGSAPDEDGSDLMSTLFPAPDSNVRCLMNEGRGCMGKSESPFSKTRGEGSILVAGGVYGWLAGETVSSLGLFVRMYSEDAGVGLYKGGRVLKKISGGVLLIGVILSYSGIFIYMAITIKMYFRCVVRLVVGLIAQQIVTVSFMINGFSETRIDSENITASKFFAESVIRALIDCVCLAVSIIVSLTLILFAQGMMAVVGRIFLWGVVKTDNGAASDFVANIIFQLSMPFVMVWCIWECAKLTPYLFEKIGDFVVDKTGVRMHDRTDLVADFKKILNPKGLYGG